MASFNDYEYVFTPLKVGRQVLKNRIIFSPMVSDYTTANGEPTQGYIDFVEEQAKTGAALITLGATPVNWDTAPDYPAELNVTEDTRINGLVLLSEVAHRHGAKISVELVHAGRGVHPELIQSEYGLAPTPLPIPGQYPYLKEMEFRDMENIIADYVDCAVRLKKAQFDGVNIHAAHGNLIAAFLSPLTNHRNDNFGGSFENRCRFPLMLLKAVREAVGDDFMLDMRISGDEMVDGGMRVEEVIEFLKLAQEYLDMVNISAGLIVDWRAQFFTMPPYYQPHCLNRELSRKVKECKDITIPVSVVGCITNIDEAEDIIASGAADACYIARALLADTEILKKSYRGEPETVRPCLRCHSCAAGGGNHMSCAVNPQLGRGYRYWEILPASKSKKVVIVGGGPAGMMAAQTAIKRGHEVVLFEKSASLGGALNDINKLPFKGDLLRYTDWDVKQTMECGADVRLNTEATPDLVMAENPDALIVALGSKPFDPPVPGLDRDNVYGVRDVDSGRKKVSGKVVVCGGGASGCESALALAMEGCEVTLVDRVEADRFAGGMIHITRGMLMALLEEYGVRILDDRNVEAIDEDGVHIQDRNWRREVIPADYVVNAMGIIPAAPDEFRELVPETYVVGDCSDIGTIKKANHSGFDAAMER